MRPSNVIIVLALTAMAAVVLCPPSCADSPGYVPTEIAVDGSGNVYALIGPGGAFDEGIYVFAPDGRLAGSYKSIGYTDVATGPDGFAYVSNVRMKQIERLEKNGSTSVVWRDARPDRLVSYMAIDRDGNFYVNDYPVPQAGSREIAGSILKISPGGTILGAINGSPSVPLNQVFKMSIGGNGTIYMTNSSSTLSAIYPDGSSAIVIIAGTNNGTVSKFIDVAAGDDGCLYANDMSGNSVWKFAADGAMVTKWDGCGPERFQFPYGVAAGHDGKVYASDLYGVRIVWFDSNRYRFGINASDNIAGKDDLWGDVINRNSSATGLPYEVNINGQHAVPGFIAPVALAGIGLAGMFLYLLRARRD